MNKIINLFDQLDIWRHFPNYQLERRADIFFSLYLVEALKAKLSLPIRPVLIPEFPVRIGTIYPDIPIDKSYKIDYVALTENNDKVIFVELKTEQSSRRSEQDKYLLASQKASLPVLLQGLLDIFQVTNSKRKYYCLIESLEKLGLYSIPHEVRNIMSRTSFQGINEASRSIRIKAKTTEALIIYVQPKGTDHNIISFHEFADIVNRHDDLISQRFSESLRVWADVKAGFK